MKRNLMVLDVNDRLNPLTTKESAARHFDVVRIASWSDLQQRLTQPDAWLRPDILLVDVSFDDDPDLGKAVLRAKHSDIVPAGPMLALPFIDGRDVVAAAFYSAHQESEELKEFPWFLIPLGMIHAKVNGSGVWYESLSTSTKREFTDPTATGFNSTAVVQALEEGHAAYIDRLLASLKDDRVSLGQVDGVRDWLETNVEECSRATGLSVAGLRADLDQAYESAMSSAIVAARDPSVKAAAQDVHAFRKKVRTFPSWTAKVPDDLTITIEGVRGRSDLAWLSLCADAVRWERDEVDAAGLYMMCDRLRQLRGASRLPIAEVKRVLEAVGAAVLADTDAYVVNIIGNLYASDARCGEILRLSVLVANMMGWSNSTRPWTTFKKLSVLDCLGVGKDRIRYKALFEAGRGFQALPGVPRLAKFSVPSKPGTYMEYGARLRRSDLTFLQAYGAATGDFTLPSASSLPFVIVP